MNLKKFFKLLNTDENSIRSYLMEKGINDIEMVFSSAAINQDYEYTSEPEVGICRVFSGYRLVNTVRIEFKVMPKIGKIFCEVTKFFARGVELNAYKLAYYFNKLADLKTKMIANTTKNTRERAEKVAENFKSKLGQLQQIVLGIIQFMAQNSSEKYSWVVILNTTSKEKTASIIMKLKFYTH